MNRYFRQGFEKMAATGFSGFRSPGGVKPFTGSRSPAVMPNPKPIQAPPPRQVQANAPHMRNNPTIISGPQNHPASPMA